MGGRKLTKDSTIKDIIKSELSDRDITLTDTVEFSDFALFLSEKYKVEFERVVKALQSIIY